MARHLQKQLGDLMIEQILQERGNNYGEFKNNAECIQTLKSVIKQYNGYKSLSLVQREALDMILHKIGRIINGNPDYKDNWIDIIGYSQLVLNELEK